MSISHESHNQVRVTLSDNDACLLACKVNDTDYRPQVFRYSIRCFARSPFSYQLLCPKPILAFTLVAGWTSELKQLDK
jgi:hypothetical protein